MVGGGESDFGGSGGGEDVVTEALGEEVYDAAVTDADITPRSPCCSAHP